MKMFFVLTCCFALASVARGVQPQDSPAPKKGAGHSQASQHAPGGPAYSGGTGSGRAVGAGHAVGAGPAVGAGHTVGRPTGTGPGHAVGAGHAIGAGQAVGAGTQHTQRNVYSGGTRTTPHAGTSAQTFHPQHYNLSTQTRPTSVAPAVTYRAGNRIQGSQTWQGSNYTAFRSYRSEWHDRSWWGSRYNRIVFVFGSPYYWDSGYWYPAWGYDPYASYYYDGPIYAYNDLPPDQVIANVQAALQAQGYYEGEVDGVLGPLTRAAIANYQRDQGLYITSTIDEPTLASLGMV
jgi:hypothetical protein